MNENPAALPTDEPEPGKNATAGGGDEIRWKVVAQTFGITPAEIIVGRLRAEGIPALAWQEGAGRAVGLVVGLLGTGHVVVPEEFEEEALRILNEDVEIAGDVEEVADEDLETADDFDEFADQ
jgi:hypothetical protein